MTTFEEATKFLNMFGGHLDVFVNNEGAITFSPLKPEWPTFWGHTWDEAIEKGIAKYKKLKLI